MWYKILFSALFAFTAAWLTEKGATHFMRKNMDVKVSYVSEKELGADMLIHGACEPLAMLDPKIIDSVTGLNCYNLAEEDADFADIYTGLYLYLKKQRAPKVLLLYVGPVEFDKSITSNFQTFKFVPFMEDPVVKEVMKDNDPGFSRFSFIPYLRYSYYNNFTMSKVIVGAGSDLLGVKEKPAHPNGYIKPLPYGAAGWEFRVTNVPHNERIEWFPIREKYFRKIIELAQARNINIVLYQSPEYYETGCPAKNQEQIVQKIRRIASEYQVPYWRMDKLPMSKDKTKFITTVNTNLEGSVMFSNIIAQRVRDSVLTNLRHNVAMKLK